MSRRSVQHSGGVPLVAAGGAIEEEPSMSRPSLSQAPSMSSSREMSRGNSLSQMSLDADGQPKQRRSIFGKLFGKKRGSEGGSGASTPVDPRAGATSLAGRFMFDMGGATPLGSPSGLNTRTGSRSYGAATGPLTAMPDDIGSIVSHIDEGEEEQEDEEYEEDEEDYEQIEASITCMALHPTEPILAVGCSPDIIKIWNIKAHKFDAGNNHSGRITALAFNSDGRYLVSAASWESPSVGWTHSMRLWTVDRKTHSITPPHGLIGQEDLEIVDDQNLGPPVPNLPRLSGNAIRLALQHAMQEAEENGKNLNETIALGCISQGVMGGKATTEDLLANTGAPPLQFLHQDQITCVAFMPLEDNPCIKLLDEHGITGIVVFASASQDRTVRVWCYDRMSDATVHVLRQHQSEVTCVSFSPDGLMLMSGSLDGSVICWRISLEPVYEPPRGMGGSGLINNAGGDAHASEGAGGAAAEQPLGRIISCVPVIIQNLKFECFASGSPHQPILEPVYCLQFFPVIHTFGRYPEYTIAVGTSGSLILLRAHAMRVHESPLTNIPQFLRVCRNLHRHRRQVKSTSNTQEEDREEEKNPYAAARRRRRAAESASTKASSKNLGLRPNYLNLSEVYRQTIDIVRYGAIRSLSVDIHQLDRSVAYDIEDSLDSKHIIRSPLSVAERQVKILLTNHENQGHTLAWVFNEELDRRTALPTIAAHFCVLGKQNHHIPTGGVIPNGTSDGATVNFLGNFCEQVLLPSVCLRKKFDKFRMQREGSGQVLCFTLNCTKDDPSQPAAPDEQGNGVWCMKFNIEASVDFPGDLEPTIASKIGYEAMLAEVADRKRKGAGAGAAGSNGDGIDSRHKPKGNLDPDFIGHLANGYEIEFDLPAFVSQLHPMGTTMNEAMRLADHQRVMGIRIIKYPAPKKVFQDTPSGAGSGSGTGAAANSKRKVLSTLDTSGFATADVSVHGDGGSRKDGISVDSSSSASDAVLASSKLLFGADDEAAGVVLGKKKQQSAIRYTQANATGKDTLSVVASGMANTRDSKKHGHSHHNDSDSSDSSDSDPDEADRTRKGEDSFSSSTSTVQWQSSVSKRSHPSSSSVGVVGSSKRAGSKLAQFREQALLDLAPKKKQGLFDNNSLVAGDDHAKENTANTGASGAATRSAGGDAGSTATNNRAQCANPAECNIQ